MEIETLRRIVVRTRTLTPSEEKESARKSGMARKSYRISRLLWRVARIARSMSAPSDRGRKSVTITHRRLRKLVFACIEIAILSEVPDHEIRQFLIQGWSPRFHDLVKVRAFHEEAASGTKFNEHLAGLVREIASARQALYWFRRGVSRSFVDLHRPVRALFVAIRGISCETSYSPKMLEEDAAFLIHGKPPSR